MKVSFKDDLPKTVNTRSGQVFPKWTYEEVQDGGALFAASEGGFFDGCRRIDNITDDALARFHAAYDPSITNDDVFLSSTGCCTARTTGPSSQPI